MAPSATQDPRIAIPRKSADKLGRWIDLLAALIRPHSPRTFLELARDVPAYLADRGVADGASSATVKRMFERDKRELRELGIPIRAAGEDGSESVSYYIRPAEFYLPYLGVVSSRDLERPRKVDRYG